MNLIIIHALACALAAGEPAGDGPTTGKDPLPATAEAEDPTLLPPEYKTLFQNEDVKVKWGGRLYNDWGWFDADDAYPAGDEDGTEFRAARLFAEGTLFERIKFKAEYDFAGNDADFKDVFMETGVGIGDFQVGHFKEPFSLEELTSSRFITFMERGLPNIFAPGRNNGMLLSGANESARFNWALGYFRESSDGALGQGDGEGAVTARLAGTLFNEDEGERVLHMGVAGSLRTDAGGFVSYADEPEAHLLDDVVDIDVMAEGETLLGGELAWVQGPLSLQGEYMLAMVEGDVSANDADYGGYYAMISYFLTGEHRNYKAKGARFDRVKPAENFDGHGLGGAWELAARYSMNDFDDGPTDDEVTNYAAGVNWYLNPNTRVMLNYVHSNFEDATLDEDGDFLMLRFQVDW
jgi:phosphate-selective porin OprO/OprP